MSQMRNVFTFFFLTNLQLASLRWSSNLITNDARLHDLLLSHFAFFVVCFAARSLISGTTAVSEFHYRGLKLLGVG